MWNPFQRKERQQYNIWYGYVSRFRGRLHKLAEELTVTLGKEVTCFYSHAKGGVLSVGGSHIVEVTVLGDECGFPVTAFIGTSLEGEQRQKLEHVFKGYVNMVIEPLRSRLAA